MSTSYILKLFIILARYLFRAKKIFTPTEKFDDHSNAPSAFFISSFTLSISLVQPVVPLTTGTPAAKQLSILPTADSGRENSIATSALLNASPLMSS